MEELEVKVDEKKAKGSSLQLGGDILPRKYKDRTVGFNALTVIWFAMATQLALFMAAAQLFPALSGWQIFIALAVAYTIVAIVMWFTQDYGIKYGLSFIASTRLSFGYLGAHIPGFIRGVPAMFWFGFQTWLGALAITVVTEMLFGWSNLLLYIVLFAAVQIASTYFGITAIRKISYVSTPVLLAAGIYILVLILGKYDVSFGQVMAMGGEGGISFPLAVMILVGGWAPLTVSIMDITKECKVKPENTGSWWKSNNKLVAAQWIGLVPASIFFGLIGVVSMAVVGDWNPIVIMSKVIGPENPAALIFILIFIFLATWSTNDSANLYSPAYILSNAWPHKIKYGIGVIIAGVIGIAMQPWRVAPELLNYMGMIGGALAPVAGILICDFFFLRKRKIDLNALYTPNDQYRYWKNFNPAAIIAYVIGLGICLPPGVNPLWDYMFIIGIVVSGIIYYLLMKFWIVKVYPQAEVS